VSRSWGVIGLEEGSYEVSLLRYQDEVDALARVAALGEILLLGGVLGEVRSLWRKTRDPDGLGATGKGIWWAPSAKILV
jgi:hypothetical protein